MFHYDHGSLLSWKYSFVLLFIFLFHLLTFRRKRSIFIELFYIQSELCIFVFIQNFVKYIKLGLNEVFLEIERQNVDRFFFFFTRNIQNILSQNDMYSQTYV